MARKKPNSRALAAKVLRAVIDQGLSLDREIDKQLSTLELSSSDKAFCKELVYGVCRYYWQLDYVGQQLLQKPIRNKDRVVYFLLLVGIYQARFLSTPDHAVVSETVNASASLKQSWSKGLLNACLRTLFREGIEVRSEESLLNHPDWLVRKIKQAWPDHADELLKQNNMRAPMCLRVNTRAQSRQEYHALLAQSEIESELDAQSQDGIILDTPCNVDLLPGFFEGAVSVQDTAAQLCADLLELKTGAKVLDACAAPGGKSAHLLERYQHHGIELTSIDIDEDRCERLKSTFDRLQLKARVECLDAANLKAKADFIPANGFDAVLLDAPCSGTGVIRRHPDIKHHRTEQDVIQLVELQASLLESCWQTLAPKGRLLYCTCSVLPDENENQIEQFVARTQDVQVKKIDSISGISSRFGIQSLTGIHNKDGFFYCLLEKQSLDI